MKKILGMFLVMILAVFLASPGWALNLFDYTDVGGIDFLEASTDLKNSGKNTELKWINENLQGDVYTYYNKYDYKPTYYEVYDGDTLQEHTYAFELKGEPEYFLIKFGDGGGDYYSHTLWANNDELDWGVINLSGLDVKSISAFSHWGEAGGTAPVPEPSTIVLMGLGLVGLAGLGRRKFKQ